MKRIAAVFTALALLLTFAACSSGTNRAASASSAPQQSSAPDPTPAEESNNPDNSSAPSEEASAPSGSSAPDKTGSNALVVYFSRSGSTKNVAEAIQTQTDADIFEIIPAEPYSDDYDTVLNLAQEEQRDNARPAISRSIENLEQYDIIYVGYPIWWGDMPMILYTFFDTYDLSGKTVALFCTSGGSGRSGTVDTVKSLEPSAEVTDGLHIGSGSSSDPDSAVGEWFKNIGLAP